MMPPYPAFEETGKEALTYSSGGGSGRIKETDDDLNRADRSNREAENQQSRKKAQKKKKQQKNLLFLLLLGTGCVFMIACSTHSGSMSREEELALSDMDDYDDLYGEIHTGYPLNKGNNKKADWWHQFAPPFLWHLVGLAQGPKPKPLKPQPFAFEAVFGDNMVLQHGSKSAIYGFLGPDCSGVQLDVYSTTSTDKANLVYTTQKALINATHQAFGDGWGVRPCSKQDCPPYDMLPFNPWNEPLPTWKFLLPPQKPGGNYTVQATCLKQTTMTMTTKEDFGLDDSKISVQRRLLMKDDDPTQVTISNVTFGDVWYCSGQSNMLLPLTFTFHKNDTIKAVLVNKKYQNIRLMAGNSKNAPHGGQNWQPGRYGAKGGSNPWMTVEQSIMDEKRPFLEFGATCWYFAQQLADLGVDIPIGLANTAIGGQRIQEYMDNRTINTCRNRTGSGHDNGLLYWEGQLFGTHVIPFADMTLKGWVWYQGENNMYDVKGNSMENIGYGCEMKTLIQQWRSLWSETPGTTDPEAPFGIVTLASSGSEGGPDLGAMRHAQSANYGVLPHNSDLPNTFIAQAYDLDDEWGPDVGPCFVQKCCETNKYHYDPKVCTNETLRKVCNQRPGGCTASMDTPTFMGGIHPRSKMQVGIRLGLAAFNLFYGGKDAYTGPTLAGCSFDSDKVLEIRFNKTLLGGDQLAKPVIPPPMISPDRYHRPTGGSQLWVQTNASQFCMESTLIYDGAGTKNVHYFCPSWAGGTKEQERSPVDVPYNDGWLQLNFSLAPGTTNAIHVDLSPLPKGVSPTAVRYAWGIIDCCDHSDPNLYVTHGCIANCPLKGAQSQLPANPFQARIIDGKCKCVEPQVCSD